MASSLACDKLLLEYAAQGYSGACHSLIKIGARLNCTSDEPANKYPGQQPIHIAIENNHIDTAVSLIQLEANLEALDFAGRTPLLLASQHGLAVLVAAATAMNPMQQQQQSSGRGSGALDLPGC